MAAVLILAVALPPAVAALSDKSSEGKTVLLANEKADALSLNLQSISTKNFLMTIGGKIDQKDLGKSLSVEPLMTQDGASFIKANPQAISKIFASANTHVQSGLYQQVPDFISDSNLADVEYVHYYYNGSNGDNMINTTMWNMHFYNNGNDISIFVNPGPGDIINIRCCIMTDFISTDSVTAFIESLSDRANAVSKALAENFCAQTVDTAEQPEESPNANIQNLYNRQSWLAFQDESSGETVSIDCVNEISYLPKKRIFDIRYGVF